uniref:Trypsin-13 n=1 Tax=Nilaparvata lugens TaxID=108931 RepID=A0A068F693_NILLU|nr:trypsin-13 [Nilaparvata lugens]
MQLFLALLTIAALRLASPLIAENIQQRIINGRPVYAGEIKYQIALLRGKEFICGGSIIGRTAVLTAAHCVYGYEKYPYLFSVRYGTINRQNGPQVTVSKIIRHPLYSYFDYDIAVLKFSQNILRSVNASAISLENTLPTDRNNLTVSGWGTDQSGHMPVYLQKAEPLRLVQPDVCHASWAPVVNITSRMICAVSLPGNQSPCKGDSGGPVVDSQTGKQVGVVSFGSCKPGSIPLVFASVPNLYSWILILSGWGRDDNGKVPILLRKATSLRVIPRDDCQIAWGDKPVLTPRMFCAFSAYQLACAGDSGSPLVNAKTGKQVGVMSWGIAKCTAGRKPDVYANVANLREWIVDNLNSSTNAEHTATNLRDNSSETQGISAEKRLVRRPGSRSFSFVSLQVKQNHDKTVGLISSKRLYIKLYSEFD